MELFQIINKTGSEKNKLALADGVHYITYYELYKLSSFLGKEIVSKFGENRTIGLYFTRSSEYIISYFAAAYSNACIVPIDESIGLDEIYTLIDYCNIDIILSNIDVNHFCSIPSLLNIRLLDYKKLDIKIINNNLTFNNKKKNYPGTILLPSSGTMDSPKRIIHTYNNILINAEMHIKSLDLKNSDITYVVLPLGFGYCNTAQLIASLYISSTIVLYKEKIITPSLFFKNVEKLEITTVTLVPSILESIFSSSYLQKYDISSLRYVIVGGSRISEGLVDRILEILPPSTKLVQTYGLSEAGPRVTTNIIDKEMDKEKYSVGMPFQNIDLKIINNSQILGCWEIGEVVLKTPSCMIGYFNREIETKNTIKNEYLYTGDLGYVDSKGYLYIVGRIKNIIIRGGKNISPEEIEGVLNYIQGVKESFVSSVLEGHVDEKIIAKVVIEEDSNLTVNDILEICRKKLDLIKIPQQIDFIHKIDKTYNGKIARKIRG